MRIETLSFFLFFVSCGSCDGTVPRHFNIFWRCVPSALAEQQELAGRGGPDGPAAHRSRSGIRQGGTAQLPLQRLPAGEMSAAFSPPTMITFFFFLEIQLHIPAPQNLPKTLLHGTDGSLGLVIVKSGTGSEVCASVVRTAWPCRFFLRHDMHLNTLPIYSLKKVCMWDSLPWSQFLFWRQSSDEWPENSVRVGLRESVGLTAKGSVANSRHVSSHQVVTHHAALGCLLFPSKWHHVWFMFFFYFLLFF